MKEIVRNSIRTGLIFAAIGAAVAVAVPLVMTGLVNMELLTTAGTHGAPLELANVVNTSLVFGFFGILDPIFQPLFSFVFGSDKSKTDALPPAQEKAQGQQINITVQQAPQQAQAPAVADSKFRQKVEAERMAMLLTGEKTLGM